jgi:hypothetical protein
MKFESPENVVEIDHCKIGVYLSAWDLTDKTSEAILLHQIFGGDKVLLTPETARKIAQDLLDHADAVEKGSV